MGPKFKLVLWVAGLFGLASCQTQRTVSPQFSLKAVPRAELASASYGQSQTSQYPDPRDYVEEVPASKPATAASAAPAVEVGKARPEASSGSEDVALQTVSLPLSAASPKEVAPAYHTVARGETLYGIGRRYGLSANSVKAANGLTSDTIYPGDVLKIPRA